MHPDTAVAGDDYLVLGKLQRYAHPLVQRESEVAQDSGQPDPGLHHAEPQSDAVAWSVSEWQKGARMPAGHLIGCETLRVEFLRVRVDGRIVLDGVDGNLHGDTGRNDLVGAGHGVVAVGDAHEGRKWRVLAEGFY